MEFTIGDASHVTGGVALPDDGELITARLQMAIKAIFGNVELTAKKPGVIAILEIDILHRIEDAFPMQKISRLVAPEAIRIVDTAIVLDLIFGHVREVRTLTGTFDDGIDVFERSCG